MVGPVQTGFTFTKAAGLPGAHTCNVRGSAREWEYTIKCSSPPELCVKDFVHQLSFLHNKLSQKDLTATILLVQDFVGQQFGLGSAGQFICWFCLRSFLWLQLPPGSSDEARQSKMVSATFGSWCLLPTGKTCCYSM